MKLQLRRPICFTVKRGQSLQKIASVFHVALALLAKVNNLEKEPEEGTVLLLPEARNCYLVEGGEKKSKLFRSPELFLEINGTDAFFPAMRVYLP